MATRLVGFADASLVEGRTHDIRFIRSLRKPLEPQQYISIRYTHRLTEAGALASIGSVGDSYGNAQIESLIGLHKLECVRPRLGSSTSASVTTNVRRTPCAASD